jgi:DNA-binding NarL/FixJ family response regulator
MGAVLRVRVVAADPLARAGLLALIAGRPALEAEPADEAPPSAGGVVLLDMGTAGTEPPEPPAGAAPVLALVTGTEQAREALAAGARGVLFRDATGERLAAALCAVAQGLTVLDAALAQGLRPPPRRSQDPVEPLTPREREVLALLAQGFTNRGIGERLGISEHTAKFHVNAILGKLGAESRTEAVAEAARLGWIVF